MYSGFFLSNCVKKIDQKDFLQKWPKNAKKTFLPFLQNVL